MNNQRPPTASFVQAVEKYDGLRSLDDISKELHIPKNEIIKLNGNENPFNAPVSALQAISSIKDLHLYPDPLSKRLITKLALKTKRPYNNIIAGAGVDELIDLLIRAYSDPGDIVMAIEPTFSMYKFFSRINRASYIGYPSKLKRNELFAKYAVDKSDFLKKAKTAKIVFLTRPNNPDGRLDELDFVEDVINTTNLVVIDEAYIEFANDSDGLVSYLNDYSNLVILRTFSKAYGLGGLRVGYGLMDENIRDTLLSIKQPYNVNVVAQYLASVVLDDENIQKQIDVIKTTRDVFVSQLKTLHNKYPNFWIFKSQGPFILMQLQCKEVKYGLYQYLRDNGILVRKYENFLLKDKLRISVGTKQQMTRVYEVISEYYENGEENKYGT